MLWSSTPPPPPPPPMRRMPSIRELPSHLVDTSVRLLDHGTAFYQDFVSFVGRDNVIEVAIALIMGSAFSAVSSSLVSDIFTPLLSLIPFLDRTLINKFIVLRCGHGISGDPHGQWSRGRQSEKCHYNTLAQAVNAGATTLSYGQFIEISLQFLFSACSLYLLSKCISICWHKSIMKETELCQYCRRQNSKFAVRCGFCTSWLNGKEEHGQDWPAFPTVHNLSRDLFSRHGANTEHAKSARSKYSARM